MQVFRFHRNQLKRFDDQHINLAYNQEMYLPYINRPFGYENFEKQLLEKEKDCAFGRSILADVLNEQYTHIEKLGKIEEQIESLRNSTTFTVTTGHQLSLMTGPLYFVIKILQVVKQADELNIKFPNNHFVPVYWMATEDHDFEEIQSFNLFGKTLKWESDQKGPVGRFNLDGLDEVRSEVKEMFKNHPDAPIHDLIDAYDGKSLTEATRNLVHELFKEYGLVIVDGDHPKLKKLFGSVIEKELKEQFSFKAISSTNEQLKRDGGKIQVKSREINLFYILDGLRSRIQFEDGIYTIDKVGTFSVSEILAEFENFPERFSPNVILRPVFQETILPNLSYTGGVGEISYWLQLKGVFDAVDCTYPMISVRNSLMWIDGGTSKKMAKIDMLLEDTFKATDLIKREFVEQNSEGTLDFEELEDASKQLAAFINKSVEAIDSTKMQYAQSEIVRLEKQMTGIKEKLIKLSKQKHEEAMKIIEFVKERLFPNDSLQERTANFFSFCPDGDYAEKLDQLYKSLNPEENDFIVIREI
ncbi:MAG: bacillithiol biosynthesis cysteine-adding enzyme BshC [Crocinitomicaceae bacterium]|nr:bacillithiol biosynthesis cysteine-adding enzyme BshC [Crocinitomicaceae bacterium]